MIERDEGELVQERIELSQERTKMFSAMQSWTVKQTQVSRTGSSVVS